MTPELETAISKLNAALEQERILSEQLEQNLREIRDFDRAIQHQKRIVWDAQRGVDRVDRRICGGWGQSET